jgi:hypothetical protein
VVSSGYETSQRLGVRQVHAAPHGIRSRTSALVLVLMLVHVLVISTGERFTPGQLGQ